MDFNRKAHPDCVYSDNPFHECASACLEKIAQGHVKNNTKKQGSKLLSFSGSFGRKKKESYTQPPSPLSARPYQNGGSGFANANSPKVHHSVAPPPVVAVKKKNVPESDKSFSSSSSGDPDDFFKPEKKLSQTVPLSSNNLVDRTKPVSPKPGKQEQNGKSEGGSETTLSSFLNSPRLHEKERNGDYNIDSDDDENNNEIGVELDLESVMSDTFVAVGKYRVRSGSSTILSTIIEKHGDIAENCKLESDSMRSRYLECLCSLMQELRSTPVGQLTKVKVKEMLAVLKDLESVNIEVAWLRSVLEEFARSQEDVESEKERQESLVKATREELEAQEADLARMEKEMAEAKLRTEETRARMVRMEKMGYRMEKFKGKSFIDELL